jgi:hypothetical protein
MWSFELCAVDVAFSACRTVAACESAQISFSERPLQEISNAYCRDAGKRHGMTYERLLTANHQINE